MLVVGEGKLSYATAVKAPRKAPIELPLCDNYSHALGTYRKRNKLSKAAMARLLKVTPMTYGTWENNGQIPARIYRDLIAKTLKKDQPTSKGAVAGRGIKQKRQRITNTTQSVVNVDQLPP